MVVGGGGGGWWWRRRWVVVVVGGGGWWVVVVVVVVDELIELKGVSRVAGVCNRLLDGFAGDSLHAMRAEQQVQP